MKRVKADNTRTAEADFEPGKKVGILTRLFGCRHRKLSRPFTFGGQSYGVCLDCGARRSFDRENFEFYGGFYFPTGDIR